MNPVEDILKQSITIHLKKRADYTSNPDANPFENFDRSNEIATWFPDEYKSFAILIGTKLARLASLLSSGKKPNNESIDDSFLDLVTYCALMYGYYKKEDRPLETEEHKLYQYNPSLSYVELGNPLLCSHNQVEKTTLRCIQCGIKIKLALDSMHYKISDNPAYQDILIRRV